MTKLVTYRDVGDLIFLLPQEKILLVVGIKVKFRL